MSSTDTSVSTQEVRDYLREQANAPRYLHVVCLKCGLIVDRRRKATDLRTPEELYERVMCGNCCARSVHGEVIFSFDGGVTFYDHQAAFASNALLVCETAEPAPNWPPWEPRRYVEPTPRVARAAAPASEWEDPATCSGTSPFNAIIDRLRSIEWGSVALCAAAGFFGLAVLEGLRVIVYVYAVALGG